MGDEEESSKKEYLAYNDTNLKLLTNNKEITNQKQRNLVFRRAKIHNDGFFTSLFEIKLLLYSMSVER